jgi:hypothetical protein
MKNLNDFENLTQDELVCIEGGGICWEKVGRVAGAIGAALVLAGAVVLAAMSGEKDN